MNNEIYANNHELDQNRLASSSIAIIGTSTIANYLVSYISGLGVGNVRIIGDETLEEHSPLDFLLSDAALGEPKAVLLAQKLSGMNEDIKAVGIPGNIDLPFIGQPDVLIDATNDPEIKKQSYDMFKKICMASGSKVRKYISVSSDQKSSSLVTDAFQLIRDINIKNIAIADRTNKSAMISRIFSHEELNSGFPCMEEFTKRPQGGIPAGIIAALAIDEARKTIAPMNIDKQLSSQISYSIYQNPVFWQGKPYKPVSRQILEEKIGIKKKEYSLSGKKVLIVGDGGVGMHVGLGLVFTDVAKVDNYDGDIIEQKNRNRMSLYHHDVGKPKSEVLAKKLNQINPNIIFSGKQAYIVRDRNPEHRKPNVCLEEIASDYDVIFSCVDNPIGKALMNELASRVSCPVIDGGVSISNGNVKQYYPKETVCINCRDALNVKGIYRENNSCALLASNIVIPNAITGLLMVDMAQALLSEDFSHLHGYDLGLDLNARDSDKIYKLRIRNKDYITGNCGCNKLLEK